MTLLWIAIGGAIGAVGRFGISTWSNRHFHHSPIGTSIVNVSGAFALGVIVGFGDAGMDLSTGMSRFIITGVLGGYTTFSTLFYETFTLIEVEKRNLALLYAVGSMIVGIVAVLAGIEVANLW